MQQRMLTTTPHGYNNNLEEVAMDTEPYPGSWAWVRVTVGIKVRDMFRVTVSAGLVSVRFRVNMLKLTFE